MDPDANVKEQNAIQNKMREGTADAADLARLIELQQALNEWRSKGGFPPRGGWL